MIKKRIFVIDDSEDLVELCKKRLEAKNYEVKCFLNAADAMKEIRLAKPDLVVSDMKMPGLNGLEVCDFLRSSAQTKEIPIILMTGYKGKRQYVESLNIQYLFFLLKPFEGKELLSTVQAALDSTVEFDERLAPKP